VNPVKYEINENLDITQFFAQHDTYIYLVGKNGKELAEVKLVDGVNLGFLISKLREEDDATDERDV